MGSRGKSVVTSLHESYKRNRRKKKKIDAGLIRTDAPEGTRFLVLRIRPLCHCASNPFARRYVRVGEKVWIKALYSTWCCP
ncbi:hypothetical protein F4820DRAFT_411429 [Hypoxylon rubiginosum]|uniref:Uncharacterized protein n=1 Tax=Hypoxylon rubiginosum TaxID=110542 RepID=A0ACB9Z9J0_9PEZI|nr:hypothetical protein F4820DRAFT_411429 [Hypoxylon rubiginosum]